MRPTGTRAPRRFINTWRNGRRRPRRRPRRLRRRVAGRPRQTRKQAWSLVQGARPFHRGNHVNKSELVNQISHELHTSKLAAAHLLDTVLDGIRRGLREEGTVTLTGFGTFEVKNRKP